MLLFALLVLAMGCGSSDNGNPVMNSQQGMVQIMLQNTPTLAATGADGPVEPREVWVNIGQVDARGGANEGWSTLTTNLQMMNLIALTGVQGLLGSGHLPDGSYSGLRLFIESGYVVDDSGKRHDLKVPSGKIEVPAVFDVKQNQVTRIVLDIDGRQSVQVIATGSKTEKWILRPVLRVASVENAH